MKALFAELKELLKVDWGYEKGFCNHGGFGSLINNIYAELEVKYPVS